MSETCDILISGGGIAGLCAAAAFGHAGFKVICVDPAPPVTERDVDGSDLRTTAFLQPAQELLETCGLWARLDSHAAPLQVMRIVDAGGDVAEPRIVKDFDAADISGKPFGWNLPNWLLRREMVARLAELDNVDFRPGTGTDSLFTREAEARVGLSDGSRVRTRLVVAADGRTSPMRQAAGIGVHTMRYGQKALAFAVTHPIAHDNVSTEIHRSGGPFTLAPLPDWQGQPSSAIVWMERGPRAMEPSSASRSRTTARGFPRISATRSSSTSTSATAPASTPRAGRSGCSAPTWSTARIATRRRTCPAVACATAAWACSAP